LELCLQESFILAVVGVFPVVSRVEPSPTTSGTGKEQFHSHVATPAALPRIPGMDECCMDENFKATNNYPAAELNLEFGF